MHIIGWIVFGLVVGLVAKFLMPGRDPGGFVITAILGIVGALVGGFVGRLIGLYGEGDPVGFITGSGRLHHLACDLSLRVRKDCTGLTPGNGAVVSVGCGQSVVDQSCDSSGMTNSSE